MASKRYTTEMVLEGTTYEVMYLGRDYSSRAAFRSHKTRVSVSGEDRPTMLVPAYTMRGDDPANDALWRKYNREVVKLMKAVALPVIHEILDDENPTLTFSRTAGCSCGCSPAFKLDRLIYKEQVGVVESIYITRK